MFLLLNSTPRSGRAAGMAITFGFCAAILAHAIFAMIGVGAVIATSATLFSIMKFAGAAYLIWLGIKSLKSISAPIAQGEQKSAGNFSEPSLVGFLGRGS